MVTEEEENKSILLSSYPRWTKMILLPVSLNPVVSNPIFEMSCNSSYTSGQGFEIRAAPLISLFTFIYSPSGVLPAANCTFGRFRSLFSSALVPLNSPPASRPLLPLLFWPPDSAHLSPQRHCVPKQVHLTQRRIPSGQVT